ncbi:flavin-containing monooxygenase [Pseudonocardia sp. RS010]|uniref:flavin-containing monooxygenase n=1 Tax=Pseudonocardia sp. RS010 TaxID=3385979 RepID=UPI0039A0AC4D
MQPAQATTDHDVIVVGAGFAGLNAIHRFTKEGFDVLGVETAGDLGGTWYWNRYPGARVDIESVEYSYGFDEDIQQEWRWPLRYSYRETVIEYLNWVADRLDLRRHIRFDTRVASLEFDEPSATWAMTTARGERITARFVVLAVGFLSAVNLPEIEGLETFAGKLVHSGAWPTEGVELAGKRVGVLGAGASAVQMMPVIAEEAAHLTAFQRTPNWCFPIRNEPIDDEYDAFVKENYAEIREREYRDGIAGMILVNKKIRLPNVGSALDATPEEREATYEEIYQAGGPHLAFSYGDISLDLDANATIREFLTKKILETVRDPEVARKLIPAHPAYAKRPPGVTGYYEMFNRDNVSLEALLEDPIDRITESGVRMASGREIPLDVLIFATGFDSGAGGALRIDIRGRGGESLNDHWKSGVVSHLGLMTDGFPNLFVLNGARSPSAFFSPPLLADWQSRHVLRLIQEMDARGARAIEPTVEAERDYGAFIDEIGNATVIPHAQGWWMGDNIPGKPREIQAYVGPFPLYAERAEAALADDLKGFRLDRAAEPAA